MSITKEETGMLYRKVLCVGVAVICMAFCLTEAQAVVTTVFDSAGFDAYAAGAIAGQGGGLWAVGSGQPSDAGTIVDIGGTNGKVVSFKAGGQYNISLLLNYQGNPANSSTIIKWSYDFYQAGGSVYGAVYSYRDVGKTTQLVKLLPQVGQFNVELRKDTPLSAYWPSYWLSDYEGRYGAPARWHHVEVYQYNSATTEETPGLVKVYVDGAELTRWYKWYSAASYWTGYIGAIDFATDVRDAAVYYVDNLKVEEGPEVTFPAKNPVHTIYDVNGFNNFSIGTVAGQDVKTFPDGARSPWYIITDDLYGAGADIVQLPNSGEHVGKGKVLSFNGTGSNYSVSSNSNIWCYVGFIDWFGTGWDPSRPYSGVWYTGGTTIKWSYDFYQTGGIFGLVQSRRNANDVTQAIILPEIGNIVMRYVDGSPSGPHAEKFLGNYDLDKWHHIEVYQNQPIVAGYGLTGDQPLGPIRVFIDGIEFTKGSLFYSYWAGWSGYFDSIQWAPTVSTDLDERYYIDNLKIEEGVDMTLPVEPCGAWGYLSSDINKDCTVDLKDLAEFVKGWLGSTDINNPSGQQIW
jgi:hypothetical protein